MALFDIDYDALIWQITPVRLRKHVMIAWLKCLVAPVKWLYNAFAANRSSNLYALAHNSQIVYLEDILNDTFDNFARGIYIIDGPFKDPLFTYLIVESRPVWLGLESEIGTTAYPDPEVLYTSLETSLLGIGFIVKVPMAVSFDLARMQAIINLYKLPGKNYTIVTY